MESSACDQGSRFLWEKNREGEAVLYRMHGTTPVVKVPEEIGGCPVTALGAYCFSDRGEVPEGIEDTGELSGGQSGTLHMTEITGDFIEKVVLPDSLRRIDNAAFFGCKKLETLELGKGELQIGSDVFTNCTNLTKMRVRGSAGEKSGAKPLLDRISWGIEVEFEDARILYPEYYETYDTIAPAHIFGLNIEGEGFRARQCFHGGVVDFSGYDSIFGKACAEESVEVLAVMALDRLMMPCELEADKQKAYEDYIIKNAAEVLKYFVRKRASDRLEFICKKKYAGKEALDQALALAVGDDWSEGAACLMEWGRKGSGECRRNRYEF